jgi:hypothetical protein
MDDTGPIVKEIVIDAAPEDIFPYLTESTKYLLWMGVAVERLDQSPFLQKGQMARSSIEPTGRWSPPTHTCCPPLIWISAPFT